jgi:hypothetical protein
MIDQHLGQGAPAGGPGAGARGPDVRESARATFELCRRYVAQETVAPLRQLGRRLVFGLAAAALFAVGTLLGILGILRLLQSETGTFFAGHWSFAPYLLTGVLTLALLGAFGLLATRRS